MPSRPDLRELATNVKEAFGDMDRETLLEILTFVVKEYVVEGPPPMLVHQAETLADLKNCTFAQLISAMQTRFDFPELQMFVVDGDQVSVRVGGVVQPLIASRQPAAAAEATRPAPTPVAPQRPATPASSGFIDTRQPGAAAPPPMRGVTVREVGAAPTPPASQPAAPAAQPAAPAAQPAASSGAPDKPDKPESSGDDASARFSLLELD